MGSLVGGRNRSRMYPQFAAGLNREALSPSRTSAVRQCELRQRQARNNRAKLWAAEWRPTTSRNDEGGTDGSHLRKVAVTNPKSSLPAWLTAMTRLQKRS